jgi:hypothetical protein
MTREFENQVLDGVAFNRRGFVRKVLVGGAFVVPAIVSFDMRSLSASAADCISPNQTEQVSDNRYSCQILDQDAKTNKLTLKLKVRDPDTSQNLGSPKLKVKLRKLDPKPHHEPDLPIAFKLKQSGRLGHYYELKLDTSKWGKGVYTVFFTVGNDPNRFSLVVLVGGC